jgi:hypothetical protein
MLFPADSTIRFSIERGFSETFYSICPVCSNPSIKITRWEDGSEESTGCAICRRREMMMEFEEED